jgi:hypothetical protein
MPYPRELTVPGSFLRLARILALSVLLGIPLAAGGDTPPAGRTDEDWTAPDEVSRGRGPVRRKGGRETRRSWISEGNACAPGSISVVENGTAVSILLDRFQLSMQDGDRGVGKRESIFCRIHVDLTPPPGMRLKGFKQVYAGAIAKSRDTKVWLDVKYRLGKRESNPIPFVWKRGAIAPSDPDSNFQIAVRTRLKSKCRPELSYMVRLDLSGMRDSRVNDFILAGIDSIDGVFSVDLEPEFAPCER